MREREKMKERERERKKTNAHNIKPRFSILCNDVEIDRGSAKNENIPL